MLHISEYLTLKNGLHIYTYKIPFTVCYCGYPPTPTPLVESSECFCIITHAGCYARGEQLLSNNAFVLQNSNRRCLFLVCIEGAFEPAHLSAQSVSLHSAYPVLCMLCFPGTAQRLLCHPDLSSHPPSLSLSVPSLPITYNCRCCPYTMNPCL